MLRTEYNDFSLIFINRYPLPSSCDDSPRQILIVEIHQPSGKGGLVKISNGSTEYVLR